MNPEYHKRLVVRYSWTKLDRDLKLLIKLRAWQRQLEVVKFISLKEREVYFKRIS